MRRGDERIIIVDEMSDGEKRLLAVRANHITLALLALLARLRGQSLRFCHVASRTEQAGRAVEKRERRRCSPMCLSLAAHPPPCPRMILF